MSATTRKRFTDSIPDVLRIGYQSVNIIKGQFNFNEDYGKYDDEESEICINTNKPVREIANSLIHESLHAIFHTYGLRSDESVGKMEEKYVTVIANGLTAVFLDNPKFLEFLRKSLHNA